MADEDYYPTYDLKFVTGDAKRWTILVEDPDPDSPDPDDPVMIPRDLTGYTGLAQIRKDTRRETEVTAVLELTGFGSDGLIHIHLTKSESEKVIKNSGWDFQLTDPDGEPETILGGKVLIKLDYSR